MSVFKVCFFVGTKLCVKENTSLKTIIKTKILGKEILSEEPPSNVKEILIGKL